jgi:excisionase family DNA binding protein
MRIKSEKAYLKAGAAAEYLGISRRHLHTLTKRGMIRHSKLGPKLLLYRRSDLDALFDDTSIGG